MSDIFNLAGKFSKAVINHAKDGFKNVEPEVYEKRINICKSCEFFNSDFNKCNNCGCFLEYKASWNSEKCPVDKW